MTSSKDRTGESALPSGPISIRSERSLHADTGNNLASTSSEKSDVSAERKLLEEEWSAPPVPLAPLLGWGDILVPATRRSEGGD